MRWTTPSKKSLLHYWKEDWTEYKSEEANSAVRRAIIKKYDELYDRIGAKEGKK